MGFKMICANSEDSDKPRYPPSKEEGKDQESIQSRATPDPRRHMGK